MKVQHLLEANEPKKTMKFSELHDLLNATFGENDYHIFDDAANNNIAGHKGIYNGPERVKKVNAALNKIGASFRVSKIDTDEKNHDHIYHIVNLTGGDMKGSASPSKIDAEKKQKVRQAADAFNNAEDQTQSAYSKVAAPNKTDDMSQMKLFAQELKGNRSIPKDAKIDVGSWGKGLAHVTIVFGKFDASLQNDGYLTTEIDGKMSERKFASIDAAFEALKKKLAKYLAKQ